MEEPTHHSKSVPESKLVLLAPARKYKIYPGKAVRLASGSPVGWVVSVKGTEAVVCWPGITTHSISAVCLWPADPKNTEHYD